MPPLGDQVRGTGFLHDGSIGELFRFASGFDVSTRNPVGLQNTPANTQGKRDMEQYQLAFETNLAPIVGQQITLHPGNGAVVGARIDLLMQRADAGECELVAKGRIGPVPVGFLYAGNGRFSADLQRLPPIPDAVLRASVVPTQSSLTYTCTPAGNGRRIGIDRDLDGDEFLAGSNPADPNSTP